MIDTIRFEIKGIPESDIVKLSRKLDKYLVVEGETGALVKEVTRGSLRGSWDNRISILVRDFEYKIIEEENNYNIGKIHIVGANKKKIPVQVSCPKYLIIEFSLAKWIHGINFLNTSLESDMVGLTNFRNWLCDLLNVKLPYLEKWIIKRIDMAINFDLKNSQNIRDYMRCWRGLSYPRRKDPTVWENAMFVSGSTTTIKIYDKKEEFKKHDEKRLISHFRDKEKAKKITSLLEGILRYEVEFHKRKLDYLEIKNIHDLLENNWGHLMKAEIYRIIDGAKTTRTYKYSQVVNMLEGANLQGQKISSARCAAIWNAIVIEGKKFAVNKYGRKAVWRANKVFEKLQINTLGHLMDKKVDKVMSEVNIFTSEWIDSTVLHERYYKIANIK